MPPKLVIKCYMCDSRVTGSSGCTTLNRSNPYVYESGSSNSLETCAVRIQRD